MAVLYTLNKNVYLVRGKVRACIYDFNSEKLYSITNDLANFIDRANKYGVSSEKLLDNYLMDVLENLLSLRILISSGVPANQNIKEIQTNVRCTFAWIEVTQQCNLRCIHCYNESSCYTVHRLSVEDFKVVVDKLIGLGVTRIQIIGGEPFFYPNDLREMVLYASDKFSTIEIFTNGTLITEDWFGFLAKNRIHIALSVYSYSAEIHDRITGHRGSWQATNGTIENLERYHIPYRVCNVLMKGSKLGVKTNQPYTLNPNKDIVRMSGRANFYLLTEDLIRRKLITKQAFRKPLKRSFCARLVSGHNCFSDKCYVSSEMVVYPCVMERRINHGKITSANSFTLDKAIMNLNKDHIHECCNCEYRYCCFDCRPNTLSGDMFEKPWYCTYDPLSGEWESLDSFIEKLEKIYGKERK